MVITPIALSAFAILLAVPKVVLGQTLVVRLTNSGNGAPIANQHVVISFLDDNKTTTVPRRGDVIRTVTDSDGEARFRLPDPPAEFMSVQVHLTAEQWHCGCTAFLDTAEVFRKGAVVDHGITYSPPRHVEPGYIQFYAKPYNLIERLLHPLLKQ